MGGEMVPHIRIEEVLVRILEERGVEETEPMVAVTAVPDPKKGERLVVLHRTLPIPIAELLRTLEASGMPNLWLPSSDSFFEVEKIPLLGSGKLDLKSLREKALEFVANEKGATRIVQAQASA
jgi:acyl-[acyl-carrier-protein]-phospholipid O-acyltransferase/long-chain-fatty-acid--[acyl-carrier-protein] ligase